MNRFVLTGCIVLQAACTTPNVSREIGAGSELAETTGKDLRQRLSAEARNEKNAAEAIAIRNGFSVVGLEGSCDIASARGAGRARTDCALLEFVEPGEGPVNATSTLEAIEVLEAYFAALSDLAETTAPGEIASKSEALLSALEQTGSLQKESLQGLAALAAENKSIVVKVVGFAAERYRTTQLRRIVRKADPIIHNMIRIASAYLDSDFDPSVLNAQTVLTNARAELLDAQESGNPARYRRAIANMRSAFSKYKKTEATATAAGLLTLRQLHGDLLKRLNGGGSVAEVQASLNDILEIAELIEKKGK